MKNNELTFDREKVHQSLKEDLERKTVKVESLPEGWADGDEDGEEEDE